MQRYFFTVPIIIFLCIIIAFFYLLIIKRDPSELPSILIDQKVPLFVTTSLFNNEPFIFEKELGKETILVNFFASWCIPCKIEHPLLMELKNNFPKLMIVGLDHKDKKEDAIQFISTNGNPYSFIGVDFDGAIGLEFGVLGIPETFLINSHGKIIYKHTGPLSNEIILKEIVPNL